MCFLDVIKVKSCTAILGAFLRENLTYTYLQDAGLPRYARRPYALDVMPSTSIDMEADRPTMIHAVVWPGRIFSHAAC